MESNNNFIHDLVEEHIAEGGKYYGRGYKPYQI